MKTYIICSFASDPYLKSLFFSVVHMLLIQIHLIFRFSSKQMLILPMKTQVIPSGSIPRSPNKLPFHHNAFEQNLQVDALNLAEIGPKFEYHAMFTARTNAGATLACGTGICAMVVAAVLEGHAKRNCMVDLPGGPLEIEWREADNHVYMTGPAEVVFHGTVTL